MEGAAHDIQEHSHLNDILDFVPVLCYWRPFHTERLPRLGPVLRGAGPGHELASPRASVLACVGEVASPIWIQHPARDRTVAGW